MLLTHSTCYQNNFTSKLAADVVPHFQLIFFLIVLSYCHGVFVVLVDALACICIGKYPTQSYNNRNK